VIDKLFVCDQCKDHIRSAFIAENICVKNLLDYESCLSTILDKLGHTYIGFPRCAITLGEDIDNNEEKLHTLYYKGNPKNPFQCIIKQNIDKINNEITYKYYLPVKSDNSNISTSDCKISTKFNAIRFDPITLKVKTDDYTYAENVGDSETSTYSYWNGKKSLTMTHIPFASIKSVLRGKVTGNFSLESTPFHFGSKFIPMGFCQDSNIVVSPNKKNITMSLVAYTGRITTNSDITHETVQNKYDYHNEGINGGWVLQLEYD